MTRAALFALALGALAPAAPAFAAPTCQTENGDTIQCGVPGAMPVGWTLSPEERAARRTAAPRQPPLSEVWPALAMVFALVSLFVLMPEFDGSRPGDWGMDEEGEEER